MLLRKPFFILHYILGNYYKLERVKNYTNLWLVFSLQDPFSKKYIIKMLKIVLQLETWVKTKPVFLLGLFCQVGNVLVPACLKCCLCRLKIIIIGTKWSNINIFKHYIYFYVLFNKYEPTTTTSIETYEQFWQKHRN